MTVGEILARTGQVFAFVAYDYQCDFICLCKAGQKLLIVGSLVGFNGRVTIKVEEASPLQIDFPSEPTVVGGAR